MGHTGVSARDRTVTKTRIKLPVVTLWDISSDSPLHWIPCHSSLNGQIDEFMHNWGLYYEKENEGSVSSLAVKGGWVGDEGSWKGQEGEGRERQLLPRSRGRDGGEEGWGVGGYQRETGWCLMHGGGKWRQAGTPNGKSSAGSPEPDQLHTEPPRYPLWGRPAMSSGDCKWIKPSGLRGKLIYSLSSSSERRSRVLPDSGEGWGEKKWVMGSGWKRRTCVFDD